MPNIIEIDASTGEVIERDFYEHEIAQMDQDMLDAQETEKKKTAEQKKKAKNRKSALDKLKELGLTPAELQELFDE